MGRTKSTTQVFMERYEMGSNWLDSRTANSGGVAHLGERIPCTDKVAGSIPVASTMRVSYKGITLGFQPNDTGSIPVTRSNKLCYTQLKSDNKQFLKQTS